MPMMMKVSKTFRAFIIAALSLILCNHASGQIFNPDPYKIDFTYLDIEHVKNEVVNNRIRRISSKVYEIKKGKLKKEIPKSDFYIVEFNEVGNPVTYRYKDYITTSDPEFSETFDYRFEYDTAGNLIHVQEYEFHSLSPEHHYEKDIYFLYDKNNKLIQETVSRKYIFKPGYQFQGRTIPNDTSLIQFIFNYDDSGKVSVVFRNEQSSHSEKKWTDTLTFNCSIDSVFIEKYIPRGVKKDKGGKIIESTRYSVHALLKGGGCVSPNSANDLITKFYYDDRGKLIKSESYLRKGNFIRRKRWTYNEKGLLQSTQVEHSEKITMYEYEFY